MTTPSEEEARAEARARHERGELYDLTKSRITTFVEGAIWAASRVSTPTRRRGAHSMERIERNSLGAAAWRAYAGDLGHDLGGFRTKAEAKDAIDTWHYFHPEEQRERDRAWVHQFVQFIREANDEGGRDEVERVLRHFESRYDLVPAVPVLPTEPEEKR